MTPLYNFHAIVFITIFFFFILLLYIQRTFAELYPLFDPFYISYDKGFAEYEDLAAVSARVFSVSAHRERQRLLAQGVMARALIPAEAAYHTSMVMPLACVYMVAWV